jgi:putative oxidoreductase
MIRKLIYRPLVDASTMSLLLRLALGVIFFAHGSQKLLGLFGGYGLQGTIGFFNQQGIPTILAYAAIFAEFFGGLMLILGFLTRLGAFGVSVNMIVAILKIHLANGFFAPKGIEFPLILLVTGLTVFLYGPGRFSLDSLLFGNLTVRSETYGGIERRKVA